VLADFRGRLHVHRCECSLIHYLSLTALDSDLMKCSVAELVSAYPTSGGLYEASIGIPISRVQC
jgi:hypothetical protein